MYYLTSLCSSVPMCTSSGIFIYADSLFVMHSDLNRLVMDYLVIEGYKSAAEEFSGEAGVITPVDFDSIESRMNIREALQRGDVQDAITRVNDLNPEVCFFRRHFDSTSSRYDYNIACTTLSPFGGGDDNALHQNFSLQYEPSFPHLSSCAVNVGRLC